MAKIERPRATNINFAHAAAPPAQTATARTSATSRLVTPWLAVLRAFAHARPAPQSVVLHEMNVESIVSTFPISLGAKISGVDDMTFTSTGESFSLVLLPKTNTSTQRKLQSDDVSLGAQPAAQPAPVPAPQACLDVLTVRVRSFWHVLDSTAYEFAKKASDRARITPTPLHHATPPTRSLHRVNVFAVPGGTLPTP